MKAEEPRWKKGLRKMILLWITVSFLLSLSMLFSSSQEFDVPFKVGFVLGGIFTLPFYIGMIKEKRWAYIGYGTYRIINAILSIFIGSNVSVGSFTIGVLSLLATPSKTTSIENSDLVDRTNNDTSQNIRSNLLSSIGVVGNTQESKEQIDRNSNRALTQIVDNQNKIIGGVKEDSLKDDRLEDSFKEALDLWKIKHQKYYKFYKDSDEPLAKIPLEEFSYFLRKEVGLFLNNEELEKRMKQLGYKKEVVVDLENENGAKFVFRKKKSVKKASVNNKDELKKMTKLNSTYETIKSGKEALLEVKPSVIKPSEIVRKKLFPFFTKGKWGFLDDRNNVVVPAIFEEVKEFSEGLAPAKFNGKWGYIDPLGKVVILFQFDEASRFENGRAQVSKNGQVFFIDSNGKKLITN